MTFAKSYEYFDAWVVDALRDLGIDAWYEPLNDITSTGGKIGGAAQSRRPVPSCTTPPWPTT